jgi:TetR/AcrR family transcriptional regulator, transcriptional repressor for nem operon
LAALMQATSLEKGGIYRHFKSKEDLAVEAFDYAWRLACDARTSELDSILNSVDKLKQFLTNFLEWRSPVPGGCPLLNLAIDADDGNPVLRARAIRALKEWSRILASIARDGIKRREIRRSVDPKRLANLIISTLEGALMISRLERDQETLLGAQSHLQRYLDTEVKYFSRRTPVKEHK